MRRNGILLLSMLLLVTGAWLALNRTSYAGGCQSSAWPKFLSMHINCWEISCVGCWRYARLIQYDQCVGATGSKCVCDEFLVTVRLRHFKCDSGCGCTWFEDTRHPIYTDVYQRICRTVSC